MIGEKEFRKGSYAFECCSMLLKIAFLRLNLRVVMSGYIGSNEHTKQLMRVFRFEEKGRYTNLCWINGKYEDVVLAMLHREEWLKRNV